MKAYMLARMGEGSEAMGISPDEANFWKCLNQMYAMTFPCAEIPQAYPVDPSGLTGTLRSQWM